MTSADVETGADSYDSSAIVPGVIYEDCAFHPVLCTQRHSDGSVSGISLIDGSFPRTCDLHNCGIMLISIEDVDAIRRNFRAYVARRSEEFGLTP